ncbi:MAG: thioredoxin domain-containing protein, partial [Myxococcota bacterium]|nr:thioredoxin domain-containing protein [Myxococcota bacterium]
MSKGTAIISILTAFVGGLLIGTLFGSRGADRDEIRGEAGEGAEAELPAEVAAGASAAAGDVERFRVPVDGRQPTKGPQDAPVTIVIFSDYECPFCKRVEPTLARIMNEYRNRVRIVWRDYPLPFHQKAMPAAIAALEAFEQGGNEKFWRYHDLLFENQNALERADLERYAQQIGLNMDQFRSALDSREHEPRIREDMALADRIGARGTPHFFINGRRLAGAVPFENFKEIIDDELRRTERMIAAGVPRNRVYAELMRNARAEAAPEQPAAEAPRPRPQPDPNAVYRVPVSPQDPQKGPADALVTIVQFSDFECPFCARVEPTIDQIVERYGRDVRVVWKNNPLPFHQNAMPAAQLAMEAFQQGGARKFWEIHRILFENARELGRDRLIEYARRVGLNIAQVEAALDNNEHRAVIEAAQELARSLGATGTPSFFINGRNLRGAQPLEAFTRVIDEELAKARERVAAGTPRARLYEEIIRNGATSPQFIQGAAPAPAPHPAAPPPPQVYNIAVPRTAPSRGPANAPVTIQIFSDFECPFCNRVRPTLDQIEREYGNRVRMVWRDYPLPFHQNAMPAHQAAREVFRQGGNEKFWRYHDLLFENQRALDRASLERYAEQVGGIDMNAFRAALDSQ